MRVPSSGRVPEQGPDWFLVATEACGGGTPDLFCSPIVLGYIGIYEEEIRQGSHEGPTRVEGAPREVGAPPALCLPRCFPDVHSKSPGFLSFQK